MPIIFNSVSQFNTKVEKHWSMEKEGKTIQQLLHQGRGGKVSSERHHFHFNNYSLPFVVFTVRVHPGQGGRRRPGTGGRRHRRRHGVGQREDRRGNPDQRTDRQQRGRVH